VSQPTPVFLGRVTEQGRLHLEQRGMFRRWLSSLAGKDVELVVRRRRKQRSLQQNAYYHGVIVKMLADHFGYRPEEMHEALKFEFLRRDPDDRRPLATVRSTTSLSTQDFEDFQERVRQWALEEHEVLIPLPNEVEAA